MKVIAYFRDGPMHDRHEAMIDAKPEWRVPKPMLRYFHGDPGPGDRVEYGLYVRDAKPELAIGGGVVVFTYRWRGWQ